MKHALIVVMLLAVSGCSIQSIQPVQSLQTVMSACVIITNGMGHGSGVHIGNGIILTAGHCIGINGAWVQDANGERYDVLSQWADPNQDIGFVQIDCNLPSVRFGDMPELLDTVFVIGTPIGMALSFNITHGIVSRLDTTVDHWTNTTVVDAAVYQGNSGGPVLNSDFELVGIIVAVIKGKESLSMCEPIEDILASLEKYNAHRFE